MGPGQCSKLSWKAGWAFRCPAWDVKGCLGLRQYSLTAFHLFIQFNKPFLPIATFFRL